ncbi:hypothetical protein BC937DRAFT_87435 [Endogone sp. FLAS-F59071]|nr:hypothetical protein BC937DRAFT_87435 [Endogone sp. FLAS-F59071]|eukprot:RUS19460.1 hypothetical protein BC937DRAFT_87435 [Endogone sp. FLAS-F59071]
MPLKHTHVRLHRRYRLLCHRFHMRRGVLWDTKRARPDDNSNVGYSIHHLLLLDVGHHLSRAASPAYLSAPIGSAAACRKQPVRKGAKEFLS